MGSVDTAPLELLAWRGCTMTVTVPLTKEEENRLFELAKGRGISPDALVQTAVKQILETGVALNAGAHINPEYRDRELDELFSAFDTVEAVGR
jgi:hypothetical protein